MHPVLFTLGPIRLYSYGLMLVIGFLVALRAAARRAKEQGLDPRKIEGVCFTALAAGLVGARGAYLFLQWDYFREHPQEILRLDHGGLVFYGGLLAGLVATFLYIRRSRQPVGQTIDLLIPPLALAHAIGRIGCFLNGCCYGRPTDLPWGVRFPSEGIPRHPTQLYEAAALVAIFGILTAVQRRQPPRPALRTSRGGRPWTVSALYGLLYGAWRFGVEFLRGDNPVVLGGLTHFQIASLGLVVLSGIGLAAVLKR